MVVLCQKTHILYFVYMTDEIFPVTGPLETFDSPNPLPKKVEVLETPLLARILARTLGRKMVSWNL